MIAVEPFSPDLAAAYLAADTVAFDTETETANYHWSEKEEGSDKKRGLSYAADPTHLSLAVLGLPTMVIECTWIEKPYTAEIVEGAEIVERPFLRPVPRFSADEIAFVRALFAPTTARRFIAHNLVFDARQVYGKFFDRDAIEAALACASFWDTGVVNLLGRWLPPKHKEDKISLARLEEHYQVLDADSRRWWVEIMKPLRDKLQQLLLEGEAGEKLRARLKRDDLPPHLADAGGKGWSLEETRLTVRYYAAIDAYVALAIYQRQQAEPRYDIPTMLPFAARSFDDLLSTDLAYTKWCVAASARGIRLNVDYVRAIRDKNYARMVEIARAVGFETDPFGPRAKSWRQKWVFERVTKPEAAVVALHPELMTEKGDWSVSSDALNYYLETQPDLKPLADYVAADTLYKRATEFLRHAEADGRIHSTIDRTTNTGRSASSQPNLQNLNFAYDPKKGQTLEDTQAGWLIADDGYVLVELDYSNAENWSQAMYGADDQLALACAQEDFHSAMAAKYFADAWAKAKELGDTKELKRLRFLGKQFTFGVPYGMGARSMAGKMTAETGEVWTVERAQAIIDARRAAFSGVAKSMEKSSERAARLGYTILWTGRRVSVMRNRGDEQYKGYTAWNSLSQGGIGELVVRAILAVNTWLQQAGYQSRLVWQVHDSLILHLRIEEYAVVVPGIIEIMATVMPAEWNDRTTPVVRWLTDVEHGTNASKWGYVPGQDYPFPKDEYVNRWGFHRLPEGYSERPVWINAHGWGDQALRKELGLDDGDPSPGSVVLPDEQPFDWIGFEQAFMAARQHIGIFYHGQRPFAFPEAMELKRALYHRGQTTDYADIIGALDYLATFLDQYRAWRREGGGNP